MGWTAPRQRRSVARVRPLANGRKRLLRRRAFPQRHPALRADGRGDCRSRQRPTAFDRSDLLPVFGPSPTVANVFYAAGHFRSGILLSALTGEVIVDLVKGRRPSIDLAPFSPARFRDGSARPVKLDQMI